MTMTGKLTTAANWVHSCRKIDDVTDVVVVKEKLVTINEREEIVDIQNNLRTIRDPQRSFWITKPQFRGTHDCKRETELLERLDEYRVRDRDLIPVLKEVLGFYPKQRMSLRQLCDSPYVYGADVSIEALVRMKYLKSRPHEIVEYTTGAFDIEKSVLGCNRINLITYIHENQVYCAILDDFLYKESGGRRRKANLGDVQSTVTHHLGTLLAEHKFQVQYYIAPDEVSLIKWIFARIHQHETDFVGIWNLDYDIRQILERLEYYGVAPEEVFCSPKLPKEHWYLRYKPDMSDTQHITDKWPWLCCTSATQFVDQMCLYARIRKAKGKESTYGLSAIAQKEVGISKLATATERTHHYMQAHDFLTYIAYNILDSVLLRLMEMKNRDMTAMTHLTGYSSLSDFSKQTSMLKNTYYVYCLENGRVYATAGANMVGRYDHLIGKAGGAVLCSNKARGVGLHAVIERPELETMIQPVVSDLDYAAVYPRSKSAFNISKETKLFTTIAIEGMRQEDIEPLFGGLASPVENAVHIGHNYFNLPNYSQMEQLFAAHLDDRISMS